jgi:predicted O-linked N-acetylglucosamine transferase (SPINDLY family)
MVVKSPALAHAEEREALKLRFAERDIDPARIEARAASPHLQMLGEYCDLHIVLDSFPYNGGMTTLEALWMGRPVLTIAGESLIARQSAAILSVAGLGEWIARDRGDFVARAVALAAKRELLGATALGLRERVRRSPLLDARSFTSALEQAYRELAGRAGAAPA